MSLLKMYALTKELHVTQIVLKGVYGSVKGVYV